MNICGSASPLHATQWARWRADAGVAWESRNRVTAISGYQDARRVGPLGRLRSPTKAYRAAKGRRERRGRGGEDGYHESAGVDS
jgi:hypothetical protein